MGVSAHVPNSVDSVEDLWLLDDMENENTNPLREVNTELFSPFVIISKLKYRKLGIIKRF